jgi:hypothetical protein
MKVEVSLGEAIDKLNILELKMKKISNPEKRVEIQKEIDTLTECQTFKNKYLFFYSLLTYVNEYIWDTTDKIKSLKPCDESFSLLSNDIFEYNQKRFRIKSWFNILESSNIKEQKSYDLKCVHISSFSNFNIIYDKIPEINYLLLEYDVVYFNDFNNLNDFNKNTLKGIFKQPNLKFNNTINPINPIVPINAVVSLEEFVLEPPLKKIFEFTPINYISGGLLGDFIHQLSIINEYFLTSGIKGNLFIANIGDNFRFGLETAYQDTLNMVKEQRYINDYKIYSPEQPDKIQVNLSRWRNSPIITKTHFHNVFKNTYGLEWGKNPWLILPVNDIWKDKILINYTTRRKIHNMNYLDLLKYGNKLVYIGFDKDGYDDLTKNGVHIEYYHAGSLYELAVAINSCELFIGGLSSPLTLALACHKNCLIGLNSNQAENIGMMGLPYIPSNILNSLKK